ncbi:phasin-related domain-containing protein [Leptospira barantonii]|uniref:Chemotaxis protein n=1 Tax=Leptospira barantonii TaxID=2023184 RepID=A0ABX4NPT9_9LEPT|nr:chemotaxis protein [Leptospira barantonii]PJZ57730.1 hypothetical protein CH367_04810 [Leptospira barantonii]
MDQQIKDGLNACFGILRIVRENITKVKTNTDSIFKELSSKGASDNSEFAIRLRDFVDRLLSEYSSVSNQVEKGYKEIRGKFSETAEHLMTSNKKEEMPISRKKVAA